MTTKYKITAGFILMVLLLGIVSVLGYRSIQNASNGMTEFNRLASMNVATSDGVANVYASSSNTYLFLLTWDITFTKKAHEQIDTAIELIKKVRSLTVLESVITDTKNIEASLQNLSKLLASIEENGLKAIAQYNNDVVSDVVTLEKTLTKLGVKANSEMNNDVLLGIGALLEPIAGTRANMARYAESRDIKYANFSREYLKAIGYGIVALQKASGSNELERLINDAEQNFKDLAESFATMDKLYLTTNTLLTEFTDAMASAFQASNALNDGIDKQMSEFGTQLQADNSAAQKQMLTISAIGVIVGLACALFIIYGLVKVLGEVGRFASAVAKGDFTYKINISEKGEIGQAVDAMKQIPTVLGNVTKKANDLANKILAGGFRDRLDQDEFSGGFGI